MAGIYIHIPFCKQACSYCNFYFSTSLANKEKFMAALLKEVELTKDYLEGEKIETIYFGGGTPSLLSADEVKAILDKLSHYHDLNGLREFTLEANPDDLNAEKVNALKQLQSIGLNRFSIGVQSFFDEDLRYMNRAHNSQEALIAIQRVQDAGFPNITIDLIYGTPTMNNINWNKNLKTAFELKVPHISSYALTVEPKTTLEKKINKGEAKPVLEEQSAEQFRILMNEMKAQGYEQYEISNFALPGKYAIHNSNYWFGKKYLGLGPSAHSFNHNARRWNVANNLNYVASIEDGLVPYQEEILTEAQKANERIMISLRTQWGLKLEELGTDLSNAVIAHLKHIDQCYYILEDGTLRLTEEGKFFADGIAAELFVG